MDRQIVNGMEGQEEGVPENLRKQLAVAVRSIQWSYAIFWSLSATQQGALEWRDGYYNGDIKTRKTVQAGELNKPDKIGLQRSEQLRELYESLLEGELDPQTKRPSAALSPEDLTDEEWYYLVCMSFVFNAGEGLPGRSLANNQTIWLCNAQHADSKVFSRSLLAKSASIQTVVCFPYLRGVIELGVTDLVSEDRSLLHHIKVSLLDFSKPLCSEKSSHNNGDDREDPTCMKVDANIVDALVMESLYLSSEEMGFVPEKKNYLDEKEFDMDSLDDCSNGCDHNHQTEDSFMVDNTNGGASQVQSWHFINDEFSNGFQGSINSSDCISEAIVNHEKPGSSPKHENAKHLHPKQLEECNHSKLSCLDLGADDISHYKRTLSSVLKTSDRGPDSTCVCCCSRKSSFVSWRAVEVHRPPGQQEMLKKVLFEVPLLHSASVMKLRHENQLIWKKGDADCGRRHVLPTKKVEHDKFSVLRSMIPSVEKIDKASILDDTILYLKELEARVEELESCMESTELEGRNQRKFPDLVEKTSDYTPNMKKRWINKRKASDIDETDPELGKIISNDGLVSEVKIHAKDREILIEMKCPYREYLLVDILEAINNLHLDAYSVQSSTLDGILSLALKSKVRGAAVSPVGMIKQALWKITDMIDKSKLILHIRTGLMTEGLLEVLLVKAEGIRHKNHLGPSVYYIEAECGCLVHKSKVTSGKGNKVWWNEKFSYQFPVCEWKHLTHLKLKIMNSRLFGDGVCIGETTIYLGGIVGEGIEGDLVQELRPSPYNVVLEDNTYRGLVVVGLKFMTTNTKPDIKTEDCIARNSKGDPTKPSHWRSKICPWKIWWWKLLFTNSERIITRGNKKFACNQLFHS